ncbi:MAG: phosphoribosylglycinamide formyltransferase [Bacteroidota bacterium]
MKNKNVVIFASGRGGNARNIISFARETLSFDVSCVFSNKSDAGAIEVAREFDVNAVVFKKNELQEQTFLDKVHSFEPDLIILAGFLLKIPQRFIETFNNKIVNIHPSLLPLYGGKGMYGRHVHNAVWENKDMESGISIHWVNEAYDEGAIIFQARVKISLCNSPEEIGNLVGKLEHEWYPKIITKILSHDI